MIKVQCNISVWEIQRGAQCGLMMFFNCPQKGNLVLCLLFQEPPSHTALVGGRPSVGSARGSSSTHMPLSSSGCTLGCNNTLCGSRCYIRVSTILSRLSSVLLLTVSVLCSYSRMWVDFFDKNLVGYWIVGDCEEYIFLEAKFIQCLVRLNIQGVFFTGPLPKKLKYGKPRLGWGYVYLERPRYT